jgi:hypothetical protein
VERDRGKDTRKEKIFASRDPGRRPFIAGGIVRPFTATLRGGSLPPPGPASKSGEAATDVAVRSSATAEDRTEGYDDKRDRSTPTPCCRPCGTWRRWRRREARRRWYGGRREGKEALGLLTKDSDRYHGSRARTRGPRPCQASRRSRRGTRPETKRDGANQDSGLFWTERLRPADAIGATRLPESRCEWRPVRQVGFRPTRLRPARSELRPGA